jgi:hypothetical protein
MKSKYFKCECGCGVLNIEYDPDWGLNIAMYERCVSRSWWNRIRLAWSALRGRPYTDMVILNNQQVADLVDYLFVVQNHDQYESQTIHSIIEKLHEYDSKQAIDAILEYLKQLPSNSHTQRLISEIKPLQY